MFFTRWFVDLGWDIEKTKKIFLPLSMGMLGAFIVLSIFYLLYTPPKIATVNVTNMIDDFVKAQSSAELPQEVLQKRVVDFGQAMNLALQSVAREKRLVLVPSEAVIAGSLDVSDEVVRRVQAQVFAAQKLETN